MGLNVRISNESLKDLTRTGRLAIPTFQRGLCWDIRQKLKLVDSVYQGFPLPAFFLWKENDGAPPWLLDGQQRHNAIETLQQDDNESEDRDVFFHADNGTFEILLRSKADSQIHEGAFLIAVRTVWSAENLLGLNFAENYPAGARQNISRLYQSLFESKVPVIEIQTSDREQVVEMFVRLNTGGTKLKKSDIQIAQLVSGGFEKDVAEKIRETLRELSRGGRPDSTDNFGRINANHLLTAALALSGAEDLSKGFSSGGKPNVSAVRVRDGMHRLALGLESTQELLRSEFGFGGMSVFASGSMIVPLIVALGSSGRGKGEAKLRAGLVQWIAWAALTERYSAGSGSKLIKDVSAARGTDPVNELLKSVRSRRNMRAKPEDFDKDFHNKFALLALYVATSRPTPRDFQTGAPLQAGSRCEWHHIFPRATLRNTAAAHLSNRIANLAYISGDANRKIAATPAEEYLPKVAPVVKRSHCIPSGNYEIESAEEFWDARREQLARSFNAFVDYHAGR